MKTKIYLIVLIALVLSCTAVWAEGRTDSYTLEAEPTDNAKVVSYTDDDYLYFRKGLVKHFTENPDDRLELTFVYPSGRRISKAAADRTVLILRNRIMSNLENEGVIANASDAVYGHNSVAGQPGHCYFVARLHPPITSYETIVETADTAAKREVAKITRPANGINLSPYAVGPFGSQADFGLAIGYSANEILAQRLGFFVNVGGTNGGAVLKDKDRPEEGKVKTFNTFAEAGISVLALRVDEDDAGAYFDLVPTLSYFHNGRQMDNIGDHGMVGDGGLVGLDLTFGWMSEGRNFSVEGKLHPAVGAAYWRCSPYRPTDDGYESQTDASYLVKATIGLNF